MPEHDLTGKGMYLWNLRAIGGAKPAELVKELKAAGLKHIYVKIADGRFKFPKTGKDHTQAVIQEAQAQGLTVWGWHYVRGEFPEAEAEIAVDRAATYGVSGYIYNAEDEYRDNKRAKQAKEFVTFLRQGLPSMPFGFSSYRFVSSHPSFPWKEMIEAADVLMPQVYWVGKHNPAQQLDKSVKEWSAFNETAAVVPTGSAYTETKGWRPTAADIKAFLDRAVESEYPAAGFWSWDFITRKDYGDLLKAVTDFAWPE